MDKLIQSQVEKLRKVPGMELDSVLPGLATGDKKIAIEKYIDHTVLKSNATSEQVEKLCNEARQYKFKAVCVNGCWAQLCVDMLRGTGVEVACVIGFPLGAMTTGAKAVETAELVRKGATEIDMVVNVGLLRDGRFDEVTEDIRSVVLAAAGRVVKVILETSELTKEQIVQGCLCSAAAGAHFVKTSTGFSGAGAKVEDVALMKKTVGKKLEVKASGGIRTYYDAIQMIQAGADRIGCSAGIAIVEQSKRAAKKRSREGDNVQHLPGLASFGEIPASLNRPVIYPSVVDPQKVVEMRYRPTTYLGVGSLKKIEDVLKDMKERGVERVGIVTDPIAYKVTGSWDVVRPCLDRLNIRWALYDRVGANPSTKQVDEGTRVMNALEPDLIIGIGGGSAIDAAKAIAVLLKHPGKTGFELYKGKFTPEEAVPLVTINTTHGTGTEVDRFAVATIEEENYKPVIAYDCIYPLFSIDDPAVCTGLPPNQTRYVSIDAINHVTEAATTTVASPFSIMTAREVTKMVATFLPVAIRDPRNLEARYYLHYASSVAGMSFDSSLLHLTHALEHTLSAFKHKLAHGLGLSILLPAVLLEIYPTCPDVLAAVYEPIVPGLKGDPSEARDIAIGCERWLKRMGVPEKLLDVGFTEADVPKMVRNVRECPNMDTLLGLSPIPVTDDLIRRIYENSLRPIASTAARPSYSTPRGGSSSYGTPSKVSRRMSLPRSPGFHLTPSAARPSPGGSSYAMVESESRSREGVRIHGDALTFSNIDINKVVEMRYGATTYLGVGALQKFNDIMSDLAGKGVRSVAVVTDPIAYKVTGSWDVVRPCLDRLNIRWALYDRVAANPSTQQLDEGVRTLAHVQPQIVIGIGGGSAIDAAKAIAVLLRHPEETGRSLYKLEFTPKDAVPLVTINTTHGTGTEVDHFAVATIEEENYKPVIAYDCIYPLFSIDDPGVCTGLPPNQTRYVSIDAINHVTEAATTTVTSPFSIMCGVEVVKMVAHFLPIAIRDPRNLEARYYLHYASAIAGMSFDSGLLHLTHSLEHTLSAFKHKLAHGLGLSILLPAVLLEIYPTCPDVLAAMYEPIVPHLKGTPGEARKLAEGVELWLKKMGVSEKLLDVGFTESDVPKMVRNVRECPNMDVLLSLSPIPVNDQLIERIYRNSLRPLTSGSSSYY